MVDRLLQNNHARSEIARLARADGLFAHVADTIFKNAGAAFRAGAEWFFAGKIDRDRVLPIFVRLPKIKRRREIVIEPNQAIEWLAHFAAEPLQRANDAFGQELFDLGNLKLPPRDNLPQRKIAALALKLFVVLLDHSAAFWAGDTQRGKITGHGITLVLLGPIDDVARHLGD